MTSIDELPMQREILKALHLERAALEQSLTLALEEKHFALVPGLMGLVGRLSKLAGGEHDAAEWRQRALAELPHIEHIGNADPQAFQAWLGAYVNEAIRLMQAGQLDTAWKMLDGVRELLEGKQTPWRASLALCYRMLGQVRARGPSIADAERALEWLACGLELARQNDMAHEIACNLHDRAMVLNELGGAERSVEAEHCARESAEIRAKIGDYVQLAQTCRLLASILRAQGRFAEAVQAGNQALVAGARGQSPEEQGEAYLVAANQAVLFDPASMDGLLHKAIDCFLKTESHGKLVRTYQLLAQSAQIRKDFPAAAKWLAHAREAVTKSGDPAQLQSLALFEALLAHNMSLREKSEG